jgi:site-specific recombinase XerD
MANRVLAAVRKFFNWCIGRGILEVSPCSGITAPTQEQTRHRVLSDEELALVLDAARQIAFPFGSIVQVLALTGQRRDEAGRWPGSIWTSGAKSGSSRASMQRTGSRTSCS